MNTKIYTYRVFINTLDHDSFIKHCDSNDVSVIFGGIPLKVPSLEGYENMSNRCTPTEWEVCYITGTKYNLSRNESLWKLYLNEQLKIHGELYSGNPCEVANVLIQ